MHVADAERVELATYQLKNVTSVYYDSGRRSDMRLHHSRVGPILKKHSWGVSFPESRKRLRCESFIHSTKIPAVCTSMA